MRIVSEVKTQQELNDLKSTMEIYLVSKRIRQIAQNA